MMKLPVGAWFLLAAAVLLTAFVFIPLLSPSAPASLFSTDLGRGGRGLSSAERT